MSYSVGTSDRGASTAASWSDLDLDDLLAAKPPFAGDEFAIDYLTDDEWNRFVAALEE